MTGNTILGTGKSIWMSGKTDCVVKDSIIMEMGRGIRPIFILLDFKAFPYYYISNSNISKSII